MLQQSGCSGGLSRLLVALIHGTSPGCFVRSPLLLGAPSPSLSISRLIPKWLAAIVPSLIKAGKCAEILKFNQVLSRNEHLHRLQSFLDLLSLDHDGELAFVKAFSQYLLESLHLTKESWNPLQSLRPSATDHSVQQRSKPVVSLTLSFDDIDSEKNAFLALAFNRMQTPSSSLLEINR